MAEDVATVETPESAQPSIASAYDAIHGDPTGSKRKPERAESGRNTTLAEEEATLREIGESGRLRHIVKTQPKVSLADAHAGIAEPEAEEFELPDGFSDYSAEDVEAVLELMGLTEDDLKEPRFAALALKELEASFSPIESEDGEEPESDEDQKEEDAEKKPEEKTAAKPAALPVPKSVEEYVAGDPAKLEALNKHIDATYQRATSMSEPVMTDVFVRGLANALQTPPENLEMLKGVADVLQYGGYALVEAAVPKLLPALIDEYMNRNYSAMMEHFAPGMMESHSENFVSGIWHDTISGEEFADIAKSLPQWGTKEFRELADKIHTDSPWLLTFDPKGTDGKSLPAKQALQAKALVVARLLKGEALSPKARIQAIQDALDKGKKSAESTNRRVSVSRAVGRAGKPTGQIGKETSPHESLMDAWVRGGGGGAI